MHTGCPAGLSVLECYHQCPVDWGPVDTENGISRDASDRMTVAIGLVVYHCWR